MDKRLFELQVRHNYFMRFTAVSICKILLASFFYAVLLTITFLIQSISLTEATKGTYKQAANIDKANGFALSVIIIASILYLIFWVSTIVKIMTQHKVVTYLEKGFYKNVDANYYESEIFHDREYDKKSKHTDKDVDKMIEEL